MAYTFGSNRHAGSWESDHIGVDFTFCKPAHPRLLDLELDASGFEQKWSEWEEEKSALFKELYLKLDELDEDLSEVTFLDAVQLLEVEVQDDWLGRWGKLKREVTSEEVEPLLSFVQEHIDKVDGVRSEATGEMVEKWAEIPVEGQREILGDLPPHEVAGLYMKIKRSAELPAKKKNG